MQRVTLPIRLRGFVDPDTRSQFEGHLEPGTYTVEELRLNHPNADTDYARVTAPGLGANDTWICIRWLSHTYGTVEDIPDPVPVLPLADPDDPRSIPESALTDLLPQFTSFTYDLDDARYPFELAGVRVPMSPPETNNCCTFVEALVARAWSNALDTFEWSSSRHRQMMIMDDNDFFSPVTACIDLEIADAVEDEDTPPSAWTVLQGWRRQWRGGHTLIIVDHHPETDRILTLESNSGYRLDGVGFRALGNLRDLDGQPPEYWWEDGRSWTWERFRSTYRFRKQATLKVTAPVWSRRS
jgi:hypothetical protein